MRWNEIVNKNDDYIINAEIDQYLESKGFTRDTPVCGCKDNSIGWQTGYYSDNGLYYNWININGNRIYFYKEYECGGMINEWEEKIEDKSIFDSVEKFNEFMDSQYFG